MFTGLIETLGTITDVRRGGQSISLVVRADVDRCEKYDVDIGASVAIDGVCLTVEKIVGENTMQFTAVNETLSMTTLANVAAGRRVNLERALKADGRLDGHFVSGHVDAVAKIVSDKREGVSIKRTIELPTSPAPLVAKKGSIAIDGIGLTIADVRENQITVALIPATLEHTTLSKKNVGDIVNIEYDILFRYLYSMMTRGNLSDEIKISESNKNLYHNDKKNTNESLSLIDKMERLGF